MENMHVSSAINRPSSAFIGASWVALLAGVLFYCVGLWNLDPKLAVMSEKGYYFVVLLYGLFSAVSIQKSVRDRLEGIPVSNLYYGISWLSVGLSILLLFVGLWNASFDNIYKSFFGIAFLMALFASIAVQKNVRDIATYRKFNPNIEPGD